MFAVNDLCQSAPILVPPIGVQKCPLVRSSRSITAIARLEIFFALLGLECLDLKLACAHMAFAIGAIKPDVAVPLAGWLQESHGKGTVLASVCGRAFLLAETGLLSGRGHHALNLCRTFSRAVSRCGAGHRSGAHRRRQHHLGRRVDVLERPRSQAGQPVSGASRHGADRPVDARRPAGARAAEEAQRLNWSTSRRQP